MKKINSAIALILYFAVLLAAPCEIARGAYYYAAANGGGGAPAWIDVLALADATTNTGLSTDLYYWFDKTLSAGTLTKYRFYSSDTFFNFNSNVKMALYDNSGNIVTNSGVSGTINAGGQYFEFTVSSPPGTSAANYKIAFVMSAEMGVTAKTKATGSTRYYAFAAYADFPPATLPTPAGSDTVGHVIGVEITP